MNNKKSNWLQNRITLCIDCHAKIRRNESMFRDLFKELVSRNK